MRRALLIRIRLFIATPGPMNHSSWRLLACLCLLASPFGVISSGARLTSRCTTIITEPEVSESSWLRDDEAYGSIMHRILQSGARLQLAPRLCIRDTSDWRQISDNANCPVSAKLNE